MVAFLFFLLTAGIVLWAVVDLLTYLVGRQTISQHVIAMSERRYWLALTVFMTAVVICALLIDHYGVMNLLAE